MYVTLMCLYDVDTNKLIVANPRGVILYEKMGKYRDVTLRNLYGT